MQARSAAQPLDITSLTDRLGFTPLSYAVFKEKPAAVEALIEHLRL